MESKTVKQWLETIADEDVRERALRNMTREWALRKMINKHYEASNLQEAILGAFRWVESPEGFLYWDNYYETLTPCK